MEKALPSKEIFHQYYLSQVILMNIVNKIELTLIHIEIIMICNGSNSFKIGSQNIILTH